MSRIRGRDTSPELIVRSVLHRMGYRFRIHKKIEVRCQMSDVRPQTSGRRPLVVRPDIEPGKKVRGVKGEGRAAGRSSKFQVPSSKEIPSTKLQKSGRPLVVRPDIVLAKSKAKGRGSGVEGKTGAAVSFVRPDIVLPKHRVAIFVHGCFWHRHRGCKNCTTPTHRRAWWVKKLEGNAARDKWRQRALRKLGWRVMVIWECEGEKPQSLAKLGLRLKKAIGPEIF